MDRLRILEERQKRAEIEHDEEAWERAYREILRIHMNRARLEKGPGSTWNVIKNGERVMCGLDRLAAENLQRRLR